jgi:hypothetical protein
MRKLFFAALAALIVAPVNLALATDGRTAVGMCIDSTASGARCAWSVNDKGEIDICNANGCVYCPSATSQCTVASRVRPRPRLSLPVGTTVMTSVGIYRVTPRRFELRSWCPRGEIKCPLLGCVPVSATYSANQSVRRRTANG